MDTGVTRLVERARKDPEFFHALVWDPETVLQSADFLTRRQKAALLAISPEDLVTGLAAGSFEAGDFARLGNCGGSCGVSCGASCSISCGVSCATSCAVSSLFASRAELGSNPAITGQLARQIEEELREHPFSRFCR